MAFVSNLPPERLINGGPGRPVGSKTVKPFSHKQFVDGLRNDRFDLLPEGIALFRHPDTPARTKFEIWKELMSYAFAKPKAQAVRDDDNRQLNVQWNVQGNVTVGAPQSDTAEAPSIIEVTPSDHD